MPLRSVEAPQEELVGLVETVCRPDLENPVREDLAEPSQAMQVLPVICAESIGINFVQ